MPNYGMEAETGDLRKEAEPRVYHGQEALVSSDTYHNALRPLRLSKSSLGEFVSAVLREGGHVYEVWALAKSPGAFVKAAISLPRGTKKEFQEKYGFALDYPQRIHLN